MKRYWTIVCILFVGNVLAGDKQPSGPAQSPEELGKRVAQALIMADTNSATVLLPPYEAYLPVCRMNLGEAPPTEENLRECHSRWMGRLTEQITRFPSEFLKATSFRADQIDAFDVIPQQEGSRTNWRDVDIMFWVGNAAFRLSLDECLQFSNSWYLVDFDWGGRDESAEPSGGAYVLPEAVKTSAHP